MNKISKIVAVSTLAVLGAVSSAHTASAGQAGQYVDDATITTKVKAALLADSQLKAMHISVQTNQGAVQLAGTVDSKVQESEAVKTANQVDGVKSVQDVMTVRGAQEQ